MFVVAVSGVDGSGKSTFVDSLAALITEVAPGRRVQTAWLRFDPRAEGGRASSSRPVSTLDHRHRGHVVKRLALRAGARRLWVGLATGLYRRQLVHQLSAVRGCDILVADRFAVDFCADLAGAGLLRITEVAAVMARLPRADVTVALSVPLSVLLARKAPEEDAVALARRRELYLELAEQLAMPVVDSRSPTWREQMTHHLRDAGVVAT